MKARVAITFGAMAIGVSLLTACGSNKPASPSRAVVVSTPTIRECIGRWNVDSTRPNIFALVSGEPADQFQVAVSGNALSNQSQCRVLFQIQNGSSALMVQDGSSANFYTAGQWSVADSFAPTDTANATIDPMGDLAVKK